MSNIKTCEAAKAEGLKTATAYDPNKAKRSLAYAKAWEISAETRRAGTQPKVPSDFIQPFENIAKGSKVFLVCRQSPTKYASETSLPKQEKRLREECEKLGLEIVGIFKTDRIHGKEIDWLEDVTEESLALGAEFLLAITADRFIRSQHYHSKANWHEPSDMEVMELARKTRGILLATICDPNASSSDLMSFLSKNGQKYSEKKPGRRKGLKTKRPETKSAIRERLSPQALEMQKKGMGYGTIAKHLGLARSTVQGWIGRSK